MTTQSGGDRRKTRRNLKVGPPVQPPRESQTAQPLEDRGQAIDTEVTPIRVLAQCVRWASWAALFFLVFSRVLSLPKSVPDLFLDSSFASALTYFRSNGLQFGADVLYSFGPLGYIITAVFTGYAWLPQLIGAFVLAAFISLLFSLTAGHLPRAAGVLLITAVVFAGHNDAIYLAVPGIVYTYFLTSRRCGNGMPIVTAVGMALIALIKLPFFAATLAAVPGIFIILWNPQKRFRAVLWVTVFVAVHSILWGIFGGGLLAFWLYLRGSFEVSAGFAQNMYLSPEPLQLYGGLCCLLLCGVIGGILFAVKPSAVSRMNLLIWGSGLFLAWKHSFVRADSAHLRSFFFFPPFFLAGVFAETLPALRARFTICRRGFLVGVFAGAFGGRPSAVAQATSLPVLCLAVVGLYVSDPTAIAQMVPDVFLVDAWYGLRDAVQVGTRYRALRESLAAQARQYDLAELKPVIGSNAVDVFGQAQGLAILNGLHYHPRPAFQSFVSYTSYLIRRNYDFYVTSPPPFVLFKIGTVDGRYPAQDDSLALASILTNYTPVGEKFDHLLLRRVGNIAVEGTMKLIAEREARVGEGIEIPDRNGEPIWCTIKLRIGILSKLRALLYQPEAVRIIIDSTSGRAAHYRYLSGPGETGFIINPLLDNQNAVREYLCGIAGNRTRQFRILAGSSVQQAFIRFYTLSGPHSVPTPSICRSLRGSGDPHAGTTEARAENLSNLKRIGQTLMGNVDRIGESAPQNGRAVLSLGGKSEIEVEGWAVDQIGAGIGSSMRITVNSRTIGCDYGRPRPDVAAALHNNAYTNSGYICHLPLNTIKAGENTLQPILAMGDASYYAAAPLIAAATR